ncbi:MAG: cation:proton antiporter [Candidatus Neoclostridium sp.]
MTTTLFSLSLPLINADIDILLVICIALVAGLMMTRLMKIVGLPNVTGYLIIGIIIGPCVLGIIGKGQLDNVFSVITDLALAFIAFSIGVEFKISSFKHIGKNVIVITLTQALTTTLLVDAVIITMAIVKPDLVPLPVAICLGAIATATAPAATLMVIRQYKAKGPVTETLLPVVALDDAVGLMVFSVSLAIAKVFASNTAPTFNTIILEPLLEIFGSLAVGALLGAILSLGMKLFKSRANRLCLCIAVVMAGCGLTRLSAALNLPGFSLSSLLVCMMIGAVYCNTFKQSYVIMEQCDRWTTPLFILFFIISGANLDIYNIVNVGIVGIVYVLVRAAGKYFGAMWGAAAVKAPKTVTRYLGLTLLPQAGVAIGMAAICATSLPPAEATAVTTIVLCATLIYELVGPVITKIALSAAGEIEKKPRKRDKARSQTAEK